MKKRALITGITGMDGSHLADLLLAKDYEVFGLIRRVSTPNLINIKHILNKINLLNGDLTDQNSLLRALKDCEPDEVYNVGAQSFVKESWSSPETTSNVTGFGCLRMLEAIRESKRSVKFYQASSSEMFGKMSSNLANEDTRFYPRSPYGVSKLYAHWMTINYRESYGMFNCSGILFNHESERRGLEFVTRKITDGVAKIKLGLQNNLQLGNLDAIRDWGYAPDYVEAMWLMMQSDTPSDYVIATGKTHTVRDFLTLAFKEIGIDDWSNYVQSTFENMRPAEVDYLCGDNSKAKTELGWSPKHSLEDIVKIMVKSDLERLSND
jgi:GDPmannose 4,6-dehydratase